MAGPRCELGGAEPTFGKQNRSRKQKRKINSNVFSPFLDLEENIVNFCF